MTTNDTLHRIRTALRLDDATLITIFASEDFAITAEHLRAITARQESKSAEVCTHEELGIFLDGLIRFKRGTITNPPADDAEIELTNNLILKKLRIALRLKDPEVLIVFGLAEREISISQIKDLFRNPAHPRFRLCSDALLNDFLIGLDEFYYDRSEG
jgi:uncharacterized protein YehS (DUF1456 family)